ncbi:MAG: hypothetical protein ABIT01_00800 [Thermoanaerobaculia bacterium]
MSTDGLVARIGVRHASSVTYVGEDVIHVSERHRSRGTTREEIVRSKLVAVGPEGMPDRCGQKDDALLSTFSIPDHNSCAVEVDIRDAKRAEFSATNPRECEELNHETVTFRSSPLNQAGDLAGAQVKLRISVLVAL